MKTYKQQTAILLGKLLDLTKLHANVNAENYVRKVALDNPELSDPVELASLKAKYALALSGLRAIRSVAPNNSNESKIADQVLFELGEEA